MQVAQQYPQQSGIPHRKFNAKSSYPSESYIDPRLSGQYGYQGTTQYNRHVYPDAVYPPYGVAEGRAGMTDTRGQYRNPETNYDAHYSHPSYIQPQNQSSYHSFNQTHSQPPHHPQYHPQSTLPFSPQPSYSQGSYITQNKPPIPNRPNTVKQVKEVIYEQQPLQIPQPVRNIQYIPQLNRYMDYVEERVKIPVEKYYTDYYQIQHVTDFVPREYEESVIEMVPQEIIRYRLEYVPVERKIVHMIKMDCTKEWEISLIVSIQKTLSGDWPTKRLINPKHRSTKPIMTTWPISKKKSLDESLVNNIIKDIQHEQKPHPQPMYQNRPINPFSRSIQQNINRNIYSQVNDSRSSLTQLPQNEILEQQIYQAIGRNVPIQKSRTSRKRSNFVTSDGYFPNYEQELRNMESSLSASRDRFY